MSRWREMVMDLGQVFGSEKSGASFSSNMFTINSDLKDKRSADVHLRRTLELHFRPLFQRFVYGGEKIACHDLRRLLQDPVYRDRLPADKIQELADVADFNRGKAISYNEFVNIVLNQLPHDDFASMGSMNDLSERSRRGPSCLQTVFPVVCRNTCPQHMVETKMADYRCLPPPFFVILVTIAQIVMYIVVNEMEGVTYEPLEGVAIENDIMYQPTKRREAWRWISYCLLHQGYVDLLFNVLIQLTLGIPLEMTFSWWRVAAVYVAGVIAGSCGHSVTDRYTGLVGASGGSYALIGAHVMALIYNWKHLNTDYRESNARKVVCSVTLRIVLICLVVIPQVALAVYRRFFMDDVSTKIGIGGYVGGLVIGAVFSDAFLCDCLRGPFKGCAALFSVFTFFFLVGLSVVLNIVLYDFPDEVYA